MGDSSLEYLLPSREGETLPQESYRDSASISNGKSLGALNDGAGHSSDLCGRGGASLNAVNSDGDQEWSPNCPVLQAPFPGSPLSKATVRSPVLRSSPQTFVQRADDVDREVAETVSLYKVNMRAVSNALQIPEHHISQSLTKRGVHMADVPSGSPLSGEATRTTPTSQLSLSSGGRLVHTDTMTQSQRMSGDFNFRTKSPHRRQPSPLETPGVNSSGVTSPASCVIRSPLLRPHQTNLRMELGGAMNASGLEGPILAESQAAAVAKRSQHTRSSHFVMGTSPWCRRLPSDSGGCCVAEVVPVDVSPPGESSATPVSTAPKDGDGAAASLTHDGNGDSLLVPLLSAEEKPSAEVDSAVKRKKTSKHVHFPENVIKSVCIIHSEEQLKLLVSYNRPFHAYSACFFASVFFVLCWCFLARSYVTLSDDNLQAAVPALTFASFGFASLFLLSYLVLVWRPGVEEREFLFNFRLNQPVLYAWGSGVAALLSLTAANMLFTSSASLVCSMSTPLVVTYLYEEYKKHSVSPLDGVGSTLVVLGITLLTVGEESERPLDVPRRVSPLVLAALGGVFMSLFLFQSRSVSRYVSNFFVLSSTIVAATATLGVVTAGLDGFSAPLGDGDESFVNMSRMTFFNVMMGALFLFLSWFSHHFASLYFDRMTQAGGFSIAAPISLVCFYFFGLPHAPLPFAISGGLAVTLGCSCVMFSGWRFRQDIEVRLALEAE